MRGNSWLGWLGGVAVLMGSVFLVTFLANFAKPGKSTSLTGPVPPPLNSTVEIRFFNRKFPPDESLPPTIQELNKPGFHDFWFTNEAEETAVFGLDRKNCTCASVEVFLVPEEWLKSPEALSLGKGKPPTLEDFAAASEAKNTALAALESTLKPLVMENQDRISHKVAPGGFGWIRLRYNNDKAGPINLFANLWYGKHDSGITSRLDLRNEVVPPMRASGNEVRLGLISKSRPVGSGELIAYSSTRTKLDVGIESKLKNLVSDLLEIKGPIQLDEKERNEFANNPDFLKRGGGPVLVAYRFLIKAKLPKDGPEQAQTEFGPFNRPFRLVCKDLDENDIYRYYSVNMTGAIDSEVRVNGVNEEGFLEFRNFPAHQGKKVLMRLETSNPEARLEIDTTRTAPFLQVKQKGEPESLRQGKGMGYDFDVIIGPNKVNGAFPREDDPTLRDSAIYFRASGKASKLIRVPVTGRSDG